MQDFFFELRNQQWTLQEFFFKINYWNQCVDKPTRLFRDQRPTWVRHFKSASFYAYDFSAKFRTKMPKSRSSTHAEKNHSFFFARLYSGLINSRGLVRGYIACREFFCCWIGRWKEISTFLMKFSHQENLLKEQSFHSICQARNPQAQSETFGRNFDILCNEKRLLEKNRTVRKEIARFFRAQVLWDRFFVSSIKTQGSLMVQIKRAWNHHLFWKRACKLMFNWSYEWTTSISL